MTSEADMERAIVQDLERYIGETGLRLISQQYRIGSYIFDILLEDRHGAKLIVELQKGTLDRNHTYKILDYYDEYKEKRPDEFIELMVIANRIPEERKKRLSSWGVSYREIPESDFLDRTASPTDTPSEMTVPEARKADHHPAPENVVASYRLFRAQKDLIVAGLKTIDPRGRPQVDWKELSDKNVRERRNWFFGFHPSTWGKHTGSGFGVNFWFYYHRDVDTRMEFVRMNVGAESPLKGNARRDSSRKY